MRAGVIVSMCGMCVWFPFGAGADGEGGAESEVTGSAGEDGLWDGGDGGAVPSINGARRLTLTIFLRGGECCFSDILIEVACIRNSPLFSAHDGQHAVVQPLSVHGCRVYEASPARAS
jgi:hypothetical protein